MAPVSARLPDFPWDSLTDVQATAAAHRDGIVDLSIGTPVDPTPEVIREALQNASNAPGYPLTHGTEVLRIAFVDWLERRFGVTELAQEDVLPVIGTKELIGALPMYLGAGERDMVGYPVLAYPTYEVGARLAGSATLSTDSTVAFGPRPPKIFYLNSPANPSGRILGPDHLRKVVQWARDSGTIVISDECYLEFAWDAEAYSILHPDICGGDHSGLLAVHSLSKRSNMAGYRIGFAAGDSALVRELLAIRKNLGLMIPAPVQAAGVVALNDDAHVDLQRKRYAQRRGILREALEAAGFTIDYSEGSLYLWATRGVSADATVAWLAERGILTAPGHFYGSEGAQHVRIAFTATDERIAAAAKRLTS